MNPPARLPVIIGLSFVLAAGAVAVAQAPSPKAQPPILVTSCGQTIGPNTLGVILRKVGVEYEVNALATVADLKAKPYKSLIVTMGASLKGMGAAGIDIEDEIRRAESLIAEARKLKITVFGAHVEGIKRRAQGAEAGDTTDEQTIDAVAPRSDILLVWKDGNPDGRFTTIAAQKKIPMVEVEKQLDLVKELEKIFK
jgi:hypothetical protein